MIYSAPQKRYVEYSFVTTEPVAKTEYSGVQMEPVSNPRSDIDENSTIEDSRLAFAEYRTMRRGVE